MPFSASTGPVGVQIVPDSREDPSRQYRRRIDLYDRVTDRRRQRPSFIDQQM